jgi:retinol dehydrogenase 12
MHGINVYSLHPGAVSTEIFRDNNSTLLRFFGWVAPLFYKNAKEGAQTTIYCSVDEQTANETGLYYS